MRNLVNQLAALPGVELSPPVSPEDIAAAEAQLGSELPQEVMDFYTLCDGIVFNECLDVPPLERVVEYFADIIQTPLYNLMVIILDEHESNPFFLFHKGPLRGYVARVSHDGDSYVGWRSLSALLKELAAQPLRLGKISADNLAGELKHSERTERDVEAGRGMIEFAKNSELDEADRPLAYAFGFDLLGDGQVHEIAAYLEHEDMFVARAARERLAQLQGAEAKAMLGNHWAAIKRHVQQCAELLRHAGHNATVVNELDIRIDPGPSWLNWEALFSVKDRPDFEQWLLGREFLS
jgi:hypothetical protein